MYPEVIKQLADHLAITQTRESESTIGNTGLFTKRDQRFSKPTKLFCLRQCGADLLVTKQAHHHISEHGVAVTARAVQLAAAFHVTH